MNELTDRLAGAFPNEQVPADSQTFPEDMGALKRLMQELSIKDLVITIEKDPNQMDILDHLAGAEESSIFQTLCQDSLDVTLTESPAGCEKLEELSIEPSNLVFTPPFKTKDTLILTSNSDSVLHYDVKVVPGDILEIDGDRGKVLPRETAILKLRCNMTERDNLRVGKVLLEFGNKAFCVNVKILPARR